MKKIKIILLIIFIISLHLTLRYFINEKYIDLYDYGEYESKIIYLLKIVNVPEGYIAYYNHGNSYYMLGEYENAIKEYDEALERNPKDRVCKVRTNKALSMLQLIDYKSKTVINDLKNVQDVLLEDSCATKENDGYDDNSQKLYNEIEELLNSNGEDPDGDGDDDEDNDNPDPNKDPINVDVDDIKNQLEQQQQEAFEERNEMWDPEEYEYYKGKTW